MATRLDRLLNEVDVFDRPADARRVEIEFLTETLDKVRPGTLFFCVQGETVDGHALAQQATDKGAVAIVVERVLDVSVAQVQVPDVRAAIAPMAASFYDHPDRRLRIAGITGTNGKTTTAQLLSEILRHHRWGTATIGTLSGQYTSPPAVELQRMLAEAVANHDHAVVMEVSSHALAQHRVDAVHFDVAVFTNLSQDHLDYHKTMSRYFEAKTILFEPGRAEKAVVNIDDHYGRQLVDRLAVPVTTYGLDDATDLESDSRGSRFTWQDEHVNLSLVGTFNVYNALAAATAARAMGVGIKTIAEALSSAPPVPGRMERVDHGQPFAVIVDFAHTPDGLENLLSTAKDLVQPDGKILLVFGCGGDRDADKRPKMGEVAKRLADEVVITNDNPRNEEPEAIAEQILSGIEIRDHVHVYLDRKQAIGEAISHARAGDVVIIAGKGHETTQEIAGHKLPFDDRHVAVDAIEALAGRPA